MGRNSKGLLEYALQEVGRARTEKVEPHGTNDA
jgi:hypothetical protein